MTLAELNAALRRFLPTATQTLFLRSALLEGDAGRDAWRQWREAALGPAVSFNDVLTPVNSFLPLLEWNLKRNAVEVDGPLGTILHASQLTEEIRWRSYRDVCRATFTVLNEAGISFIALKGAALCQTAYPSPLLRHSGDVDLLVRSNDLQRAARLLITRGWRWSTIRNPDPGHRHLHPLAHPSGLPLDLHDRLLIRYYRLDAEQLWRRSRPATIAGESVRVLTPEDTVIHVCAHAMGSHPILRWVPDVYFTLETHPNFSWPTLVERTREARLALPIVIALDYLSREIGIAVPPDVISALQKSADQTGLFGRIAAQPWAAGSVSDVWNGPGAWWQRALALTRRAFPSPVQVFLRFDLQFWELPYYYVHRTWSYVRRLLRRPSAASVPPNLRRHPPLGQTRQGV